MTRIELFSGLHKVLLLLLSDDLTFGQLSEQYKKNFKQVISKIALQSTLTRLKKKGLIISKVTIVKNSVTKNENSVNMYHLTVKGKNALKKDSDVYCKLISSLLPKKKC